MRQSTFQILAILLVMFASSYAAAQTDLERAKNLTTCLGGHYPILCKRSWLSVDESRKVESAERRENLKTCLTGKYPILCNKAKLLAEEAQQVLAAEKRENLKTCATGRYKALCKKGMLSESELKQVLAAEQAENLRTCLTGRYQPLCNKSLLTKEQLTQTQLAEGRAEETRKQYRSKAPAPAYSSPTFMGYPCTVDCSGHEAGYEWAEDNGIDDPDDCGGNSDSFVEGCQAYAEEQQAEVEETTDDE